jgi:hypothetical protein
MSSFPSARVPIATNALFSIIIAVFAVACAVQPSSKMNVNSQLSQPSLRVCAWHRIQMSMAI